MWTFYECRSEVLRGSVLNALTVITFNQFYMLWCHDCDLKIREQAKSTCKRRAIKFDRNYRVPNSCNYFDNRNFYNEKNTA